MERLIPLYQEPLLLLFLPFNGTVSFDLSKDPSKAWPGCERAPDPLQGPPQATG